MPDISTRLRQHRDEEVGDRTTLNLRAGNTDEAWARFEICPLVEGSFKGRRTAYRFDEDGHEVPFRRHHPESPRRTRPSRLLRKG